ncbi:Predicted arabinose efflux permease, MFS family [Algoriphagus faecimaris]|uniref:Predicted arabinose efflux permease, MFS family n=1 Tax=Algoriphagus faecimaris TaxID=686796 RepID=A0A1G6M6T7_9BACT|nr:MFS transporter [Algoriphagus faecimaris]SDC51282.1 Predicted arabinose efflux permease, MFS family [Algoriphagus faecimaris]
MSTAKLGLRENLNQFILLVIVNAFVGAMVGLERSIFPEFAREIFGVTSSVAVLSFITAFGISKALSNYISGRLANHWGRKNLLIIGWIIALPIPLILLYTQSWNMVIFANVLLGVSQGLTWSSTVVMKIDLVGEKNRGLAMGLNEFAGYLAVGLIAFVSAYLASQYGIRPYPFLMGLGIAVIGLILSVFWVKDTRKFVHQEATSAQQEKLNGVFIQTTFLNKTLSSITQAGLINNLNDGMIWGLLPILLMSKEVDLEMVGIITAIYPAVWGLGQLFTGKMADLYSKKKMLFFGMLAQGLAILLIPSQTGSFGFMAISVVSGLGTALVYPTFMAAIADATSPLQRAESVGTFRLWRDLGYAVGAILSGIIADSFGINWAIFLIGGLTLFSAGVIQFRIPKNLKPSY